MTFCYMELLISIQFISVWWPTDYSLRNNYKPWLPSFLFSFSCLWVDYTGSWRSQDFFSFQRHGYQQLLLAILQKWLCAGRFNEVGLYSVYLLRSIFFPFATQSRVSLSFFCYPHDFWGSYILNRLGSAFKFFTMFHGSFIMLRPLWWMWLQQQIHDWTCWYH